MSITEMVAGRSTAWKMIKKLGEGDAGEVYLVESLLEGRLAILKRPHRGVFPSEAIRQASQIETEGKILHAADAISLESRAGKVRVPALLDISKPGTEYSERYFIVIEKAAGFDLNALARAVTLGKPEEPAEVLEDETPAENVFFRQLVDRGWIPRLLLLRILFLVLTYLQEVHHRLLNDDGLIHNGALWNDIKPDHLFWDAKTSSLTLIDWGNGKFLKADGTTKDRQSSVNDDARQFLQEMGRFLANFIPALHTDLDWPEQVTNSEGVGIVLDQLSERIKILCFAELDHLALLRQKERDLVGSGNQTIKSLQEVQEIQEEILQFGELPDYEGTEALALRLSTSLASQGNLVEFGEICRVAAHLPLAAAGKWQLLEEISQLGLQEDLEKHPAFNQALVAGLVDDWPGTLWVLAGAYAHQGQPAWWSDLGRKIRHFYFQIDEELLPPLLGLSRIFHVLQANLAQIENQSNEENAAQDLLTKKDQYQKLVENLKTEILTKWGQTEPEPPDSGLDYQDLERILDDLGQLIPNARLAMLKTLDQPNAQVRITLEAWNRKEFDTARKGLRRLLTWDPHRWRVFTAERAILRTPEWLEAMRYGPIAGETLGDYMTRMELMGRELRSRVGPAVWMDGMLRILQRLRKGARAQELIAGNSELVSEMPWIGRVGWVHTTTHTPVKVISLEREMVEGNNGLTMSGIQETRLGLSQGFVLGESLDTWAPEARGSSARVFLGYLQNPNGHLKQSAVKIMRGDRTDYALPLFLEEITILRLISDVPGVSRLLECGFVKFDRGVQLPPETTNTSGREVRGEVHRFGLDSVDSYLEMIESRVAKGWHPYVVIEKRNTEDNLMLLCDAGYTHGKFLSLAEGLRVAIQICDIFHEAHNRNIVYRDHKILHYYWQELYNGVFMIDWNVAKYHPQGITVEEKQFDLVQFGARALHHIFTGRTAPGALPMGPTRPEEIDAAAHSYRVQWTYDDQRLPFELKELLERVLAGGYTEFLDLRNDLVHAFNQIQGL